jgi:hypothetical protein
MNYLVWLFPILAVIVAIASGPIGCSSCWIIAAGSAPEPLSTAEAIHAAAQGLWLAALVGAVILSGLFFRNATEPATSDLSYAGLPYAKRRAACFEACFLIGPFTEATTGPAEQLAALPPSES